MLRLFVASAVLCVGVSACFHAATPSVVPEQSGTMLRARGYAGHGYKTIFAFNGADGSLPNGPLIAVKNELYGTTTIGGNWSTEGGTVFAVSAAGKEKVLHSFGQGADGRGPVENLAALNGTLYGTTAYGGKYGGGTVFSVSLAGSERVLHSFGEGKDGKLPGVGLTALNGVFYGMTAQGGKNYGGTIYTITPAGKETVIYNFPGRYGGLGQSAGALTLLKGTFYGATFWGGCGSGTAFSATAAGMVTILHRFACGGMTRDGMHPDGALVAVGNTLYGTTSAGGRLERTNPLGTVYSLTPSGKERVIHTFGAKGDGSDPECKLLYKNGLLYGDTIYGGANGDGMVFSLTPSGKEDVLYNFGQKPDGENPEGGLVDVGGVFYGPTSNGGGNPYGSGTVFSFFP